MRVLLVLAMLAPLPGGQQLADVAAPPRMPFVDRGACPFECCMYGDWSATAPTVVYDSLNWHLPSPQPGRVAFAVTAGEIVTAMTGVVVTTKPGVVRIGSAVTVMHRSLRFPLAPEERVSLKPGDVLYLLTYHGEGEYTAWFNGRLLDAVDTLPLQGATGWPGKGVLNEAPVAQWWVQVRNEKGQTGWTNQPEAFGNKDACG